MTNQFQVTLLSNACQSLFPDNVPNRFTTKLYSPIEIKGEWEVALLGILYPFSLKNVHEIIRIGMLLLTGPENKKGYEFNEAIIVNVGESFDYGNFPKNIPHTYREIVMHPGYFKSKQDFYRRLNTKIQGAFQSEEIPGPLKYVYDPVLDIMNIERTSREMRLFTTAGSFPSLMGGIRQKPKFGSKISVLNEDSLGTTTPPLDRVSSMFVYCDIIKYQAVGDIQAPLLSVLPVNGTYGKQVYWHVSEPNFIPLAKNYIQTIDIRLCTETGQSFPISNKGIVVCILSFRQKQYK